MTEIWLPVIGFENAYSVSDQGRVRSEPRTVVCIKGKKAGEKRRLIGKILSIYLDPLGYPRVNLCINGVQYVRLVHHLMLEAFLGPRPPDLDGLHWDDDRTNLALGNLRWGTKSENMNDRVRNGRHHGANKTHCPSDHPYDRKNPNGKRACSICNKLAQRKYRARRKAKTKAMTS